MITQKEAPKFLNDNLAREMFPSLAKLEGAGDESASEILDNFAHSDMPIYNWMILDGEELVSVYRERLFVGAFAGDDVMRTRVQFGIPGHVTVVYEMTDDNYAAVGISFKDNVPVLLHYNDRTYNMPASGAGVPYKSHLKMAQSILDTAWAMGDDSPEPLRGSAPIEGIYPPIVNCRRGFNEEDSPRAYAALLAIRAMVKEHSPYAEDILFTSESTECNLYHPDMALRTYDRHSSDYTDTWNFVWRDFAVQWYGRFTRSPNCNRELSETEFEQLLAEAKSILANHNWPAEPTPPKPLTPERLQAMTSKLQRNGQSGAFGLPTDEERRMLSVTRNSRYGAMHSGDQVMGDAEALRLYREQKKKSDK